MGYRYLYTSSPLATWKAGPEVIKIIGVPFDGSVSYRSGSRWGPTSFRQALLNIEVFSPRYNVDLEEYTVSDLGDVKASWSVESNANAVKEIVKDLVRDSSTPILIVGGEHSLTFGSFQAMPKDCCLIVFDAHFDLREEYAGLKLSHATYLRRLAELVEPNRIVHVGARAATRAEWEYAEAMNIATIPGEMLSDLKSGKEKISNQLKNFEYVYVSIDLDVLDPAYAPGVGNPEPGGLSVRELMELFEPLRDAQIRSFDIVELCPPYDLGSTSAAAARLAVEIVATQIVRNFKPVRSISDA